MNIISGQSDSEIIKKEYATVDLMNFDKIYCSPSIRCQKTLEILGNNSLSAEKIVYDNRLLERDMGHFEGLSKTECKKMYPKLFMNGAFDVFQTPPQGESYEKFKKRVSSFYDEILKPSNQLNILVCSHNQTLKLLRLLILGKNITYKTWMEYSFENGEFSKVKN